MTYANGTRLAPTEVTQAAEFDLSAALAAIDASNGNFFHNDPGRTFLLVKNTSGSPVVVTIETPGTVGGLAIADKTFTIPATTGFSLLPSLGGGYHQPGTNDVFFSCSPTSGVTARPIHVQPPPY